MSEVSTSKHYHYIQRIFMLNGKSRDTCVMSACTEYQNRSKFAITKVQTIDLEWSRYSKQY